MEQADITIIGAGVVGLSISAYVAKPARAVFVLEKNESFGQESSSRNSEVLHAGIYYPQNSLKAKNCVEGNRIIYEICAKENIPYKKLGKLIVAGDKDEVQQLEYLLQNGQRNGVLGLEILSVQEMRKCQPNITALAALYSPNTGIVDSHRLMRYFFHQAKARGAEFVFQAEARKIEKQSGGYQVTIRDADGTDFLFFTHILINCAGLNSDTIAESAGIDIQEADYILKFCKGEYFRVAADKGRLIRHLIYPVPEQTGVSLGIHVTPDLSGGLRLGPDAQYVEKDKADYNIDPAKKAQFYQAVKRFLPFIELDDLVPDICGIRAKLQGPENGFRDFIISHEEEKGFPGLINLIGIDSPGLTSCPAIAKYVQGMIEEII